MKETLGLLAIACIGGLLAYLIDCADDAIAAILDEVDL